MKTFSTLAVLVLGAVALPAQSATSVRLDAQPDSKLWIEGGSNLRDWSCKAATFEARADVSRDTVGAPAVVEPFERVIVRVAVRDLKCGNVKMDRDLYAALEAGDSSSPSQILGIFNATPGAANTGSALETEGTIAVAGVEKSVRVRISLEHLADGTIKARGSVPLLMTDFGVKPPTGMFGLVRSHNEIVVKFELIVAGQATAPSR